MFFFVRSLISREQLSEGLMGTVHLDLMLRGEGGGGGRGGKGREDGRERGR